MSNAFAACHRQTDYAKLPRPTGSWPLHAVPELAPLDPERVIRVLAHRKVRYVLIGALAARLYGFPRVTAAIDITPDRDPVNLKRLAAALRELEAKVYSDALPEGREFDCSAATLSRAATWNLVTSAGRLDVAFAPSRTDGYLRAGQGRRPFRGVRHPDRGRESPGYHPLKSGH
jgi:hypothetical protein